MSQRATQARHFSRPTISTSLPPHSRTVDPQQTSQCTPPEPTWEELLGRR
jgi:hypothetical protein